MRLIYSGTLYTIHGTNYCGAVKGNRKRPLGPTNVQISPYKVCRLHDIQTLMSYTISLIHSFLR